jgi:GNAT superfamily N-acetyltransferase
MTLSTDSIKLTNEEKNTHNLGKVPFASIPAIKVGKLAINKKLSDEARRKGYGSFLLEMARAYAYSLNELGIACKFITVDADIEYDENTPEFYKKNGFIENLSNRSRNQRHTISMRLDIFNDDVE